MCLKLLACPLLLAAIWVCSGCGKSEIQVRLEYTVKMARDAESGNAQHLPVVRARNAALVAALATTNVDNLHDATLAYACYTENDLQATLLVAWLQDQPTPDSVELISSAGERSILLPIDPADMDENRKAAKDDVQYDASFLWKKPAAVASRLKSPEQRSHWTVHLLHKGQVCSNAIGLIW